MRTAVIAIAAGVLAAALAPEVRANEAEKHYSIETQALPAVAPGAQGKAEIKIKMKAPAYISNEAPFKVALSAKNLKLEKQKLGRDDAEHLEDGPVIRVPFTAGEAGKAELQADMTFFVCTKTLCERQKKTVTIPVEVK